MDGLWRFVLRSASEYDEEEDLTSEGFRAFNAETDKPKIRDTLHNNEISRQLTNRTGKFIGKRSAPLVSSLVERELGAHSPRKRMHISHRFLPSTGKKIDKYASKAFCGQFNRDGTLYMSTSEDRFIRFYDTSDWTIYKKIKAQGVGWNVVDTDYSPDGRWAIYSSWSDYVFLCSVHGDNDTHEGLEISSDSGGRFCMFSVAFSSDSREILGGCSDNHLYIIDLDSRKTTLQVAAHDNDINSVDWADDSGNILLSASDDSLCKVWDRRILHSANPQPVGTFTGHSEGLTCVSSKKDGRYFITNSKDQSIKLWDLRNPCKGVSKPRTSGWDYRYGAEAGACSANQRKILQGQFVREDDCSIMTYRGHQVYKTLIRCHFSPIQSTAQQYIYSGSADSSVYVYDVLSGQIVKKLSGHGSIVRDVSWHPHEPTIVSASWDSTIRKWTVA